MNKEHVSKPMQPNRVRVTDPFWKGYQELVRHKVIPYQWQALNDLVPGAQPSYCMHNFRVAAGMKQGVFGGMVFQDSDLMKWLEAVGFALMSDRDPALERMADDAVDAICAAQQPDGYLNSYYILHPEERRFTNLMDNHELYCLGHMIEAAIAYYEATGKDKFLRAAVRYVDYVDSVFGTETEKQKGYPGHEVIEMALVRLYDVTGEERHLRLASYFINQRGQAPLYFKEEVERNHNTCQWASGPLGYQYYQAGLPVREQTEAQGHAVRAVYLYAGMAALAAKTNDDQLVSACQRLWESIVRSRMYITGGIGSSAYGEAFTYAYDLPPDTAYAETCASIGLVFFARRMLELRPMADYADVMERALYNGIISGISLDGTRFFYVNPLEVVPEACAKDHLREHVKGERQKWFGCACCPPNIARLLASLASYAYTVGAKDDSLYMHLYLGGVIEHRVAGARVELVVETNYPWEGSVSVRFSMDSPAAFLYALRVPGWCQNAGITLNGDPVLFDQVDGYALFNRTFHDGDCLVLTMEMPVRVVSAHPRVREAVGQVAVCRGPLVYCLEEADNGPGLHLLRLPEHPQFAVKVEPELLGGVTTIACEGLAVSANGWHDATLYRADCEECFEKKPLRWIPYYAWANREPGEMRVWLRR